MFLFSSERGQSAQNTVCCSDFQYVGRYINSEHFQAHISYIQEYSHILDDTHMFSHRIPAMANSRRNWEHATWRAGSMATNTGQERVRKYIVERSGGWLRWRMHGLASDSLYSFVEAATLETELEHECNQMYYILCNLSGDWSAEDSWKKANDAVRECERFNERTRDGARDRDRMREGERERVRRGEMEWFIYPPLGAMISWENSSQGCGYKN